MGRRRLGKAEIAGTPPAARILGSGPPQRPSIAKKLGSETSTANVLGSEPSTWVLQHQCRRKCGFPASLPQAADVGTGVVALNEMVQEQAGIRQLDNL